MKKTFTTLDVLNIVSFNNKLTEEKNNAMGIKVRWALKKAVGCMTKDAADFEEFRETEVRKIQEEFFGEEKSKEVVKPKLDSNGKEILDEDGNQLTETVRQVKDEYLDAYQVAISSLNANLEEITKEKHEYEYKGVDIDSLVETLPDDTALTFEDLSMLDIILGE